MNVEQQLAHGIVLHLDLVKVLEKLNNAQAKEFVEAVLEDRGIELDCEECEIRQNTADQDIDVFRGLEAVYAELRRGEIGPACREYIHAHLGRIL